MKQEVNLAAHAEFEAFYWGQNVNVGGGSFNHLGWVNLDERTGFKFTPQATFPVQSKSAHYVYSSHCLEHLDDATVDRVLYEARRVLKGKLVLKLPDFEDVLKRRQAGDHAYFKQWGFESISHMWVEDSIDLRASMIFCGYWNDAYGHEFHGERRPRSLMAYHGPVGIPLSWAKSPHEIAASLKDHVEGHFNHQNAWSRAELVDLLTKHGFTVESLDTETVCKEPIPTINDMKSISMYVLAR
jgi:hypothetical protein